MADVMLDGIKTRYEVIGAGPPLLMFSPGGFDATVEKWSTLGIYAKTKPLSHLSKHFTCIVFDRRECGQSGGKVEHIGWAHYAYQGKALLDHLGISRAHILGGCMGVSSAISFATLNPAVVQRLVLYWPVGGAKYRINGHQRFADHLGFVNANGLQGVVDLVTKTGKSFGADSRGGPWASVIRNDPDFASSYASFPISSYMPIVSGIARGLLDRDTAPGAEPEDLMQCTAPALVIPGHDASHATSAARYLAECLSAAEYWDMQVEGQTEAATSTVLLNFLRAG